MDALRVLCNFKLDTLDELWVKSVWDAEFLIYEEPPDEYLEYLESDDTRLLLRESRITLKSWIAANSEHPHDQQPSEFSWQDLMILKINVHGLLAMLDYVMKTGQRVDIDEASRQACLEATSLYLMLLAIPGSSVFRVYHSNLYERAMETLKMSENVFSSRRKSAKEADASVNSSYDDKSSNHKLSDFEKLKFVEGINRIISDLMVMLKVFRLRERTESLDLTIRTLLDITRLETYTKMCNNVKLDYGVALLSKKAFAVLQELCSSNHGTTALTIMLIAQYMLPYFQSLQSVTNNHQLKIITIVHEASIYFLKDLLKIYKEETTQGIVTLMHQLMVQCSERSCGRQKQAIVVLKLLNICSKNVALTVLKDIILYSYSGKISYRLFAQEIIGQLLTEFDLLLNNLHEETKIKMKRVLIATALSRCIDRSPLVRAKAMTTLVLFSECNNDADKTILKGIFEATITNKRLPALDDLEKALTEDADPLPGSDTLIDMLLDQVNDERAMVRRNGLRILRNLCVMFPWLVGRVTHVISERCRDPMLTVRQFAVHELSEILKQYPHEPQILHEWTQAVMPQIYDVEGKVQEKVLECLQDVLINRVTHASVYKSNYVNSLPWRILNKLSDMRMRKHLSKACSLWAKGGVISASIIANLQSHVGTENTISAWILLAAVAENMQIPGISKYVADYKEIIRKNDFHASLVLHVLRHTWSCLGRECLEDLHRYLYQRISRFEISFNLISMCLDIFNNVLRYLHDASEIKTSMAKLMKLSEAEVQDILKEDENDGAQDTLKMRAIITLGHTSLLCTDRISSSTLQILRRLLLASESLPKSVREMTDLHTSAVVLLCQQALRDREIAKKVTPMLGELMRQETDSPAKTVVKVNAAKALADICVRFTALVEPYLPDMCISMKDPDPAVRETIVVIFIQLLLEDFIKIKGPFFFHILTMLSDADSTIRELTVFLVEERLLVKNKTLISQQFLASIYYYNNNDHGQNAFCGYKMCDKEKKALTLPGRVNQDKRHVIYEFMLDHLDPPAKCKLLARLTKHILCEICDGNSIDVKTEKGACVLEDTLFIIGNNRFQLSPIAMEKHRDDSQELDETAIPSQVNTTNNTTNAIAAMKKHNLDILLPALITLKKKLHALKSALESYVERLLFKIYSDYEKEQLLSLLNEYPELEKDMERYQRYVYQYVNESRPPYPDMTSRDVVLCTLRSINSRAKVIFVI